MSAAGGRYNYALGSIKVSEILVPRKKVVVVEAADGRVTVSASEIEVKPTSPTILSM